MAEAAVLCGQPARLKTPLRTAPGGSDTLIVTGASQVRDTQDPRVCPLRMGSEHDRPPFRTERVTDRAADHSTLRCESYAGSAGDCHCPLLNPPSTWPHLIGGNVAGPPQARDAEVSDVAIKYGPGFCGRHQTGYLLLHVDVPRRRRHRHKNIVPGGCAEPASGWRLSATPLGEVRSSLGVDLLRIPTWPSDQTRR